MRTSKRVTLDVNTQNYFATFKDSRGPHILFQQLDLELACHPDTPFRIVEVIHQLLAAYVKSVSCELVDWDRRLDAPRETGAPLTSGASFRAGQLAQLRSGGPMMTVVQADASMVQVTWFNGAHGIQTASFHPSLLIPDTRGHW